MSVVFVWVCLLLWETVSAQEGHRTPAPVCYHVRSSEAEYVAVVDSDVVFVTFGLPDGRLR